MEDVNFEVEGSGSEDEDESWNEEDYFEEKSIDYKDPFEDVNGVLELQQTW